MVVPRNQGDGDMTGRIRGGKVSALGLAFLAMAAISPSAVAQQEPAVQAGLRYLRSRVPSQPGAGESGMMALAMIKAEVPATDPALAECLKKVRSRFTTSEYFPERTGGQGPYEAGVSAMALANLDPIGNRPFLQMIVNYLLANQNANGSWDYKGRTAGDTSITQYAVLALWEAESAGVRVPPHVWERIASFYISTQLDDGGWVYHHDEMSLTTETVAMTAAATGSLLICHRQLDPYRIEKRTTTTLLTPLGEDGVGGFKLGLNFHDLERSINRGMSWISSHFTTSPPAAGQSPYYMLYGLERIGALSNRKSIGRLDWYERGLNFLHSTQKGDGSWDSMNGADVNTSWGILFLTKSTAKTLRRIQIQRLGAGTLLGGRGLPRDLSSMTIAGGRVVSRPMNGAIEGMLAVLEDPRAEQAEAAVAGLVERYYREGPDALRPFKLRFRKMLTDRDPGLRRVAAWSLAHTGDMDVVPNLIDTLLDPDPDVVDSARMGLELISRKIEGLGPPSPSTPAQRKEAAARWRDWYNTIRPLDTATD